MPHHNIVKLMLIAIPLIACGCVTQRSKYESATWQMSFRGSNIEPTIESTIAIAAQKSGSNTYLWSFYNPEQNEAFIQFELSFWHESVILTSIGTAIEGEPLRVFEIGPPRELRIPPRGIIHVSGDLEIYKDILIPNGMYFISFSYEYKYPNMQQWRRKLTNAVPFKYFKEGNRKGWSHQAIGPTTPNP